MGDIYYKNSGVWTKVTRTYLKTTGTWTSVKEVDVKSSGIWKQSFVYDVTPPPAPVLSLSLITHDTGRYIQVSAHTTGTTTDLGLRRIRVLTTYNGASPTSQYGATFTEEVAANFPNEPWSEFSFNGYNDSNTLTNTANGKIKDWPRNATVNTQAAAGTYYFAAWSEDFYGNWSTGTFANITLPKIATNNDVLTKEKDFVVNHTASIKNNSVFNYGDMIQQDNPRSNGIMMYGSVISDAIGKDGTPTIKSAQIFVNRRDDSGKGSANVYLYWHNYPNKEALPTNLDNTVKHDITKIGTIAKGESKWMSIPDSYLSDLQNGNIKGFGFNWRDPDKTANENDYSVLKNNTDAPNQGKLHVVWTEKP